MGKKPKIPAATTKDLNTIISNFIGSLKKDKNIISDFEYVKQKEELIKKFIAKGKSQIIDPQNQLIILRKWNSFTPLLPSQKDEYMSKGGGYFIRIAGIGIVIDPGFNFIENFLKSGFKLDDIDHIFISHAHNDHTVELEGIFSLLFKRNKNEENDLKTVKLYMNLGSFKKFSAYFDLSEPSKKTYISDIILLNKHQFIKIDNGIELFTTATKHHEMITKNYALGFTFVFILNGIRKIVKFTCDTGWDKRIEEINKKIGEDIGIDKIDLLIAHIGSIKRKELEYRMRKSLEENLDKLYEHHLGLIGTAAEIHYWNPEMVLLSEFGEELDAIRHKISSLISSKLNKPVISTDINFRINLDNFHIMCFKNRSFHPANEIQVYYNKKQLYPILEASLTEVERNEIGTTLGTTIKVFVDG